MTLNQKSRPSSRNCNGLYHLANRPLQNQKNKEGFENLTRKFGTAPVFFTAISTILGAIMFLRFGFSVGNVGLAGTFAIILIGHMVTIPTAMAIAEIATNQKVEGGGEYYIISRSFGLVIGSAIGITPYLSQAISVAFISWLLPRPSPLYLII
ncbi:MAG: hypothetical protein R2769_04105 [Saprospiraceae bacterium]